MNDFDYENLQKKRLARNAFARKGTTGRKGCTLPHEYLNKKGREALNGELTTLELNRPISWERFKTLKPDLQKEYLQHQIDRFSVGLATISRDLFGKGATCLPQHLYNHNIIVQGQNGRTPKAVYESWKRWCNGDGDKPVPVEEPTPTPIPTEEQVAEIVKPLRAHDYKDRFVEDIGSKVEEGKPNCYPTTGVDLTLKGTPTEIMAALVGAFPALLDPDKAYRCTIHIDDFVL